jgi:hypothetical protein
MLFTTTLVLASAVVTWMFARPALKLYRGQA